MSNIVVKLLRPFKSVRCLEEERKLQERRQTEEKWHLLTSPLDAVAEAIEIAKTDTFPVKTMTVLQIAPLGMELTFWRHKVKFLNLCLKWLLIWWVVVKKVQILCLTRTVGKIFNF